MGVRGLGSGDDLLFARARLSDGDVLADRAPEQENILADIGICPRNERRDTPETSWPSISIDPEWAS
jgi:hypothetical protein